MHAKFKIAKLQILTMLTTPKTYIIYFYALLHFHLLSHTLLSLLSYTTFHFLPRSTLSYFTLLASNAWPTTPITPNVRYAVYPPKSPQLASSLQYSSVNVTVSRRILSLSIYLQIFLFKVVFPPQHIFRSW